MENNEKHDYVKFTACRIFIDTRKRKQMEYSDEWENNMKYGEGTI